MEPWVWVIIAVAAGAGALDAVPAHGEADGPTVTRRRRSSAARTVGVDAGEPASPFGR